MVISQSMWPLRRRPNETGSRTVSLFYNVLVTPQAMDGRRDNRKRVAAIAASDRSTKAAAPV